MYLRNPWLNKLSLVSFKKFETLIRASITSCTGRSGNNSITWHPSGRRQENLLAHLNRLSGNSAYSTVFNDEQTAVIYIKNLSYEWTFLVNCVCLLGCNKLQSYYTNWSTLLPIGKITHIGENTCFLSCEKDEISMCLTQSMCAPMSK